MRVALSSEVQRTHEELVERILHAGLAYTEAVDPQTSLVVCNEPAPEQGKGYQARELGVPVVSDEQFMDNVGSVAPAPASTTSSSRWTRANSSPLF